MAKSMLWVLVALSLILAPAPSAQAQEGPQPTAQQALSLLRSQKFEEAAQALERVLQADPEQPRLWIALGLARHSSGDYDGAIDANQKALEFPSVAPQAMYNLACSLARKDEKEMALEWLQKAHATNKVNMTQIQGDADLQNLQDDPRFQALLPSPDLFAEPFVEPVQVIHEWVGESAGDQFGWIARNIGDVDGDGIQDVTASAPTYGAQNSRAGRVYAYSGKSGRQLWAQTGEPQATLGLGIEAAGDTNADGIPDVIAGAPGIGKAYVYAGDDGRVLLTLGTGEPRDVFGRKVSDIGDLNRDGFADVIVGAPGRDDGTGAAFVYSGKDGSQLLQLSGEKPGDGFGSSAAGVRQGETMLLVVGAGVGGSSKRGKTYVYQGDGTLKFAIDADATGANLGGMFVSVVGDIDNDDIPDVYASDFSNSAKGPSTGRIVVHSGADGRRLLTLTGENPGDGFGIGPADAGDVNGDGHDDLVVGAWQFGAAAPSGGKVYVYSGKDGALLKSYTCKVPGETFGFDATGMGDVDGDGSIDFLLTSAWSAIKGARTGRMFILSGKL